MQSLSDCDRALCSNLVLVFIKSIQLSDALYMLDKLETGACMQPAICFNMDCA